MTMVYHKYILIDGPFRIDFEVHCTCRPQDNADLIAQDGLGAVPWVFLAGIVGNNGRNDSTAENFIVEPIREVRFLKRF